MLRFIRLICRSNRLMIKAIYHFANDRNPSFSRSLHPLGKAGVWVKCATSTSRADADPCNFYGGMHSSYSKSVFYRSFSLSSTLWPNGLWGWVTSLDSYGLEKEPEKSEIEDGDPQEDNTIVIVVLDNEEYAVRKKHLVKVV